MPDTFTATTRFQLSQRAQRTGEQPISYLMAQAVENPNLISLAAGLVDYDTLPWPEVHELVEGVFTEERGPRTLQYGTTPGDATLRMRLLEHLAALDGVETDQLDASPDDIVISTGSQQLLFMLTDVLVDPGDIVITAAPSYFVYASTLETFGAKVRTVDMDAEGMIPESLEAVLQRIADEGDLTRVKIVYICDYHQNPTGLTLSEKRRPKVLEIVKRYSVEHRILLLEDAAYRELTYEGDPPHSIKKFDTSNEYVALLQTFSKPFAPGFKTGYGLLPRDLVEPVNFQKGNHDFGSPNLCQQILLRAMETGAYASHVHEICQSYAMKRDAMLEALDEHLGDFEPGETHWTKPTGGLYVYLTLPERIDTSRRGKLFSKAVAKGVLYVPGEYCYPPDDTRTAPGNCIRLSFGVPTIEQVHEGIERLADAIKESG